MKEYFNNPEVSGRPEGFVNNPSLMNTAEAKSLFERYSS
jgi:hypothetical protein